MTGGRGWFSISRTCVTSMWHAGTEVVEGSERFFLTQSNMVNPPQRIGYSLYICTIVAFSIGPEILEYVQSPVNLQTFSICLSNSRAMDAWLLAVRWEVRSLDQTIPKLTNLEC